MSIIAWILLGLVAGWLGSTLMGHDNTSIFGDILVGILGAVIGGFLGSALLGWDVTGFNVESLIVAVIGSMILIAIYRAITGGRRTAV